MDRKTRRTRNGRASLPDNRPDIACRLLPPAHSSLELPIPPTPLPIVASRVGQARHGKVDSAQRHHHHPPKGLRAEDIVVLRSQGDTGGDQVQTHVRR